MRALQALLGITRVLGNQQEDTFGFVDNGTPGPSVGRGRLTYNLLADSSTAGVEATSGFGRGDVLATHGHFLVRENQPPVADAGPDQTIYRGDSAILHGTATDADGHTILGWQWEVISAPAGSAHSLMGADTPNAVFGADTVGDYVITLIAWDGLAWSEPDALLVMAVENQPPTAVATAAPLSGPAPLLVHFDGTGSSDPEGDTLLYDWDFGDVEFGSGPTPSHTYSSPGTYVAILTVVDVRGLADFVTIEITVGAGPIPALPRWALAVLALLLVGAGDWLWRRRRRLG